MYLQCHSVPVPSANLQKQKTEIIVSGPATGSFYRTGKGSLDLPYRL